MTRSAVRVALSLVALVGCVEGQLRKRRRTNTVYNEVEEFEQVKQQNGLMDVVIRFKKPESSSSVDMESFEEEVQAMETMSGCFDALSDPVTVHTTLPTLASAGALVSEQVRCPVLPYILIFLPCH